MDIAQVSIYIILCLMFPSDHVIKTQEREKIVSNITFGTNSGSKLSA